MALGLKLSYSRHFILFFHFESLPPATLFTMSVYVVNYTLIQAALLPRSPQTGRMQG
jgi:hypothetical protein